MAVVSQDVADGLRRGEPERITMFTASCAERMAQLFTGLQGDDPDRAGDVEILVEVLDELWDFRFIGSVFTARVEQLERFVEVVRVDDGEQLNTAVDTYSFYAVLSALHAVGYRATGDSGEAVWCAHMSLTAMGLLDQNVTDGGNFEAENEHQRHAVLHDLPSLLETRARDREVSLERLLTVRSML